MTLTKAVVLSILLMLIVPPIYEFVATNIGYPPSETGVPTVGFVRIFVGIYPFVSYTIDRITSDGSDDAELVEVLSTVPTTAVGELEPDWKRKTEVDKKLMKEYAGVTLESMHDSWKVCRVVRERVRNSGTGICAQTDEKFPLDEEHYRVSLVFRPTGMFSPDPVFTHFRFKNREAIEAWFDETVTEG